MNKLDNRNSCGLISRDDEKLSPKKNISKDLFETTADDLGMKGQQ